MLYRDFASQDDIDAQYNIERQVPDARRWLEFFVEASARTRSALACELDLAFGPTLAETLDIFPAARPDAPVVVFVHGGYWRRLSAKEFSFVAAGPVARGYTVVVTNYALCPAVSIGEITRQSRAALAWLYRHVQDFGGDPERIVVSGHSAGGHQVARLLATDWLGEYGLPPDLVKGGYAISGLFDLRPLRYSWLQPMIQLDGDTVLRESPQLQLPRTAAPLIAAVGGGESEEFHRQSRDYVAACQAVGLGAEYQVLGDCHHFNVIESLGEADGPLTDALCEFVASSID
ncbi:MAG: alpha/beta hydrolase [Gammaproteobacteria bacterium]|nr:alpha/beta hydrolase [Planctomycetota bacterium]MCB1746091.1 alpha/beta hydrolase [Gammaproteobacteria bacterium]MCP5200078.1 alpha/beta hydrolase [Gammaproteobacteria bacterium]